MRKLFAKEQAEEKTISDNDANLTQLAHAFWDMHCQRINNLKELLHFPDINECVFIWTMKSFNAFTIIPFCIEKYGFIHELSLSTYTISKNIIDILVREVDNGRILNVNIFVSESLKFRMPAVINHIDTCLPKYPQIKIIYAWNHSKVSCLKCGETYLVLEGSGNWSANAQYEQYVFINSKKIYEFRKALISMVE